jgi:hypothetical protein
MRKAARKKLIFKAPAPRKGPQVHRPAKGKGSFRRKARRRREGRRPPSALDQ